MRQPATICTPDEAIRQAVYLLGGADDAAEHLGVRGSTVRAWLARGRCSASKCRLIEVLLARRVTAEQLRPDIFRIPQRAPLAGLAA